MAARRAARRFANGFFLKQEIVSSSRRRRRHRRHAMCLVGLSAENSKHSCYDISRLSCLAQAVFSKVEN